MHARQMATICHVGNGIYYINLMHPLTQLCGNDKLLYKWMHYFL